MADYSLSSFSRTTLPLGETLTFDVTDLGTAGTYPYTITLHANRGTFDSGSVTVNNPSDIFPGIVYTATSAGSDTISGTNDSGNTNPAGQAITVMATSHPPLAGILRGGLLGRGLLGGVLRR